MNKVFKALLLSGIIILWGVESRGDSTFAPSRYFSDFVGEQSHSEAAFSASVDFQQPASPVSPDIIGAWEFEKAEYMERPSAEQPYRLKKVIEKEEGLYAFEPHFNNMVKSAVFMDEAVVIDGLFERFCGRYHLSPTEKRNQWELTVGSADEIGLQSADLLFTYNAPGLRYLLEMIDEGTVSVTLEQMFYEDNVMKFGAVRCILKKV